jgi:hypothetical protein
MSERHNIFEPLLRSIENLANTSIRLFKLKMIEKVADILTGLITGFVILTGAFFILVLLSVAGSLWLGEILGKTYYGFLAMAGFYILLMLILYKSRNLLIKNLLIAMFIRKMMK